MKSTDYGVAASMERIVGAFRAPTAHVPSAAHAAWAVAANAPQRKRRTAAATDASVNRGFA